MSKKKFTMVFKDAPEDRIRNLVGRFQKEDGLIVNDMFHTDVMDANTGEILQEFGKVWAVQCMLPKVMYYVFRWRYKNLVTIRPNW